MPDDESPWMKYPLMTDQPEGAVIENDPEYVLQTRQPYGGWEPFSSPREDRDEVTRIQAYHLNKDPEDMNVRVLKKVVTWTVDEVPGRSEGQTPPEEILARNEEITDRLLKQGNQQPAQ